MLRRSVLSSVPLALGLSVALFAACSDGDQTERKEPLKLPDQGAQTGIQRLSAIQYTNSIHDLFGDDVVVPTALEPDLTQSGFVAIGASYAATSPRGVEQYEKASYDIAKQIVSSPERVAALLPCEPAGPSDGACAKQAIERLGRRVLRRPLSEEESKAYAGLVTQAGAALGDFEQALGYGISALLQSPSFLFRTALGEADPDHPGRRRYTDDEMATRLSYFLWNTTPDAELMAAADAKKLTTDDGLKEQARRLLDSPRARSGLRNFVTEYLGLGALTNLAKDTTLFTAYSTELGGMAREETLLGWERLVFDLDSDYREIFTTHHTFVNAKLSSLYEIQAPTADGFAEVILPHDGPRRGLLGQASLLMLYAHPVSSSATLRGKFVRKVLLCGNIPPPPVNVNTALPEASGTARTLRERVKEHLVEPPCASCHLRMDPIGLGLENFDGIGRFRTLDHEAKIDPSGDVDGARYADGRDLGRVVSESPALVPCFVRNVFRYATGYGEATADEGTLAALTEGFQNDGHRIKSLFLSVATSPAFRQASDPR
jgi:hypothetical protein